MAPISPLRRRMIEDMTVRNLSPATQRPANVRLPLRVKLKWLHHKPFRIRRIAFIPQALASIMSTSDFSPDHRALPRIFANPKESQPAEITQLLFQSGSKLENAARSDFLDRYLVNRGRSCGDAWTFSRYFEVGYTTSH